MKCKRKICLFPQLTPSEMFRFGTEMTHTKFGWICLIFIRFRKTVEILPVSKQMRYFAVDK